jgi:hypothetical protein
MIMQLIMGVSVLAAMAGAGWIMYTGVATVERRFARLLLADARARDARDAEFAAARAELAELR